MPNAPDLMTTDPHTTFRKALALHQRGDLAAAQALYEDVLRRLPEHFDSLHLLGLTFVQRGDPEAGVGYIARALAVRSDVPEAHYNMGNALLSLQRPADALTHLDRAILLNPRDPQYHFERGNALKDLRRPDEALASFDAALGLFPGYAEAHNNAGIVLREEGRLEEAVARYDRAIALDPRYAEAYGNRGNALKDLGRLQEAMASHDRAIALKPDYAEAHSNRGIALARLRLFDEALASHDRALALRPGYAEAHNNRGTVLKELGRLDEALASYDTAIRLRPGYAEAHGNRGNALARLGRMDEALASHDKALALQPDFAEGHVNRGNLLRDLGRLDEALAAYEKAASLGRSPHMALYNKSLVLLQRHSFEEGFDLYRHRWEGDGSGDKGPEAALPRWDGTPRDGEILLWAEQGLGDEVFFASMLSLLDLQSAKFALSADRRLHPAYERSFPGLRLLDRALTRTRITGDFVAQAPLGDLGHLLRLDRDLLARRRYPYLLADEGRKARLRECPPFGEGRQVCGLSWRSGNSKEGAARSLRLADLAPLLEVPHVSFVNLQYGDVGPEIAEVRERLGIEVRSIDGLDVFGDIDGLLALMDVCDMVVTIDNLTAHLAGAIGKRASVLVPTGAGRHWYWGGESPSLWYPGLNLHYQQAAGDWTRPIAEASRLVEQGP